MSSLLPIRCQRLKELRKEKNITQSEIAKQIDVNVKTYRSWEIGTYKKNCETTYPQPDLDNLIRLATFYNCSIDYLIGISECRHIDNYYILQKTGLSESVVKKLNHFTTFMRGNERLEIINYLLNNEDFAYFLIDNIIKYYHKYTDYKNALMQYNSEQILNPIELKKKFDSGELKPSITRNKLNEYKNSIDATQFIIQNDMREIVTSLVEQFYNKNHKMG